MQIRMVWAIRISMVRKMIKVWQLRTETGARTAIPIAHTETRMDWANSMESRIREDQMVNVTAIVIAIAMAAARDN